MSKKQKSFAQNLDGGDSLLQLHLDLIEGRGNTSSEEALRVESIKARPFRPLTLPEQTTTGTWEWILSIIAPKWSLKTSLAGMALIAVCLAAILLYRTTSKDEEFYSDLTIKGTTKIFVIVEKDGERNLWKESELLSSGSRINAEILPTTTSIGFLGVYDAKGHLLSDSSHMSGNALHVETGKREHFKHGFELVGQNEGETLAVIVCEEPYFNQNFPEAKVFVEKFLTELPRTENFDTLKIPCGVKTFRLRW